ncbi:MAG: hypothetical protein R6U96_10815 [Promethearchaeia archaeon]
MDHKVKSAAKNQENLIKRQILEDLKADRIERATKTIVENAEVLMKSSEGKLSHLNHFIQYVIKNGKPPQLSPTERTILKVLSTIGTTMSITGGFVGIHAGILATLDEGKWTLGFIFGVVSYGLALFSWSWHLSNWIILFL